MFYLGVQKNVNYNVLSKINMLIFVFLGGNTEIVPQNQYCQVTIVGGNEY